MLVLLSYYFKHTLRLGVRVRVHIQQYSYERTYNTNDVYLLDTKYQVIS